MDIANATSIFDSEAYKKALDTKVGVNNNLYVDVQGCHGKMDNFLRQIQYET